MKPIGALDDPEPPPTRYPLTHKGCLLYFHYEARELRAHGEVKRIGAVISRLHRDDGLSYDQIQGLMRHFFGKYEQEIRDARREYSAIALFQSRLQRIINAEPKPITAQIEAEQESPIQQRLKEQLRAPRVS